MLNFKKILTITCALSLVFTMLFTAMPTGITVTAAGANWDGSVAESFASGSGTAESPYIITTASELARAVQQGAASNGVYYKLANDIVINSDLKNNPTNWFGASNYEAWKFCGTFDGNGHTISGLYYSGNEPYAGLFPIINQNARIKNLGIENSVINGGECAGVIAGYLYMETAIGWVANGYSPNYPSLAQCYIAENVTVNADYAGGFAGRAVGAGSVYITLYNCFIGAKINGAKDAGADVGTGWPGWGDYHSYPENVITTTPFNTDLFGYKGDHVYTTAEDTNMPDWFTKLTETQAKGTAAETNMLGLNFTTVWQTNEGEYPSLRIFNGVTIDIWDGTVDQSLAGDGTADSPYLVTSAAELAGVVTLGKAATTGKYYRLTADVDLSAKSWYFGNFTNNSDDNVFNGSFDGAGHKIYGLNIVNPNFSWGLCTGLFPVIGNNAHIKSIGIIGANIDVTNQWHNDSRAGFIFGGATLTNSWNAEDNTWYNSDIVSVEYCYVDSTSKMAAGYSGGIGGVVTSGYEGQGFIRISNCGIAAEFDDDDYACGGIGDIWNAEALYDRLYTVSDFSGKNAHRRLAYAYSCAHLSEDELNAGAVYLDPEKMTGEAAAQNMAGFDFDNVWQTTDGEMPTIRVFNRTSLEQPITAVQISTDGAGTQNGTKFVVKNTFPGTTLNEMTSSDIVVNVKGKTKTVKETGIIIMRSGADAYDLDEVRNDPITGYRIKGYVKGAVDTEKLNILESGITFGVTVKGTKNYAAQTYTVFTDGTSATGDICTSAPAGSGSADGYTVNDGAYALGDANFDGEYNVLDLVRIKKYSVGAAGYKAGLIDEIVDVTADGAFNAADVAEVKKYLINGKTFSDGDTPIVSDYSLVWSDEFDSAALNTEKWGFNDDMGGYADMYTATGSDVQSISKSKNGESFLRLRNYYNGAQYVAPKSVNTKETMNFTYGYVEMRAKLPTGQGVWPSFWLKSADTTSVGYNTEVDVVEIFGDTAVNSNLHKWFDGKSYSYNGNKNHYNLSDGEWHTYGMKWNFNEITMYIDGQQIMSYNLNTNFGPDNGGMNGFREPMYLIINNHLFTPSYVASDDGTWAASHVVSENYGGSVYDIDYVRLYQNADCSITIK